MTRPLRDPDLLELLADKPELLAIADAVAATQQPPREPAVPPRHQMSGRQLSHALEDRSVPRRIEEGQVVILDSGTITAAIARALRNFRNVTVITNAVNIAVELSRFNLDVILTGGNLKKNSFSLVGPMAEGTLRRLSADVFFLGVDGFDVEYGLTTPNLMEAKVNRTMMDGAKVVVAVCDSSKFGKRSLCLIDRPTAIRHVITDRGISGADLNALKQSGIEVTVI